ncbi:conserved Plasmodium protein, unknown function [Plasmodium gaboni]|uniref:GRIP domain-containing protein n=1 Tax=Plasmodium gaboni TaxID=647221 RepID=A0ABY1USM2_9APIC|nr:conserved Plasmodium protein, unknown function [Plasmodium gaboni]
MDNFLIELKKISEQYNNLLLEKKKIDEKIRHMNENIKNYEHKKEEYLKQVEKKKNELLMNKNKHIMRCQKMEELNKKLNDIIIKKQNIDDNEEKCMIEKQMNTIKNTFTLLKYVQKLNDIIGKKNNYYKLMNEKIHNNNFTNKKNINILNNFLNKNTVNMQQIDNNFSNCINYFKIIETNDMIKKLNLLFSNTHTNLSLEKQQFLFVLLMNVLKKIIQSEEDIIEDVKSGNEFIHNFLYNNYILQQ